MPDFPEVGVKIVADMADYDDKINEAISKADSFPDEISIDVSASFDIDETAISQIEELDGFAPEVSIDATIEDTGDIDELQSLDGEMIEPDIAPSLDEAPISEVTDLDSTTVDPDIAPSLDEAPISEVTDLNETSVEPEIDPKETDEGREIVDSINRLAALEAITIVMNIAGTVLDFVKAWQEFTVGPILDVDAAAARLRATTGNLTEDWETLITDIWGDDLGDVNVIADVMALAEQLEVPLEEATRAALTFTHTFTDQNPLDVLNALNALVESGLADSFTEASDMLTVSFQQGADKAGDFLTVIQDNATMLADMGLSGEEAMSLITSGLDAGFASASDVMTAVTTLKRNLTDAAANPDNPVNDILDTLGLENPIEQGQEVGAEFLDGLIGALNETPDGAVMAGDLFGKQGVKNVSALLGLDTETNPFQDMIDAAEEAATEMDNHLMGAIDDFVLAVQVAANDFLSSEQIDLPGKIEAIKQGIQEALDVLAGGGTVGEAIEIGLNIPGFSDSVDRFTSGVGNFLISVLELIAGIQEFTGHGDQAAGTREEIARLAGNQLAFDLQVANEDEIANVIAAAVARGVDPEAIGALAATAVNEMLASGDVQGAQNVIDSLNALAQAAPVLAEGLSGEQIAAATAALREFQNTGDVTRINEQLEAGTLVKVQVDTVDLQAQVDAAAAAAIEAFNSAMAAGNIGEATDIAVGLEDEDLIAQAQDAAELYRQQFDEALAAGDIETAATIADQLDDAELIAKVEDMKKAVEDAAEGVSTAAGEMTTAVIDADGHIVEALVGNTVTTAFEAVKTSADENFPVVIEWFGKAADAAAEFDDAVNFNNATRQLAAFAAQVESFPVAALQAIINAANGFAGAQNALAAGSTTTNNVNVTNNNQNGAQVAASTYDVGAMLT